MHTLALGYNGGFKPTAPDEVPHGHRRARFEVPPLFQTEQLHLDLFYLLYFLNAILENKKGFKALESHRTDRNFVKSDFKPKQVLTS